MFTKEELDIKKSSWHYALWQWTYSNSIWDKAVKKQKSICQYVQRIIWIGSSTIVLHVLYFPLKLVLYQILYRILNRICVRDWITALVIWVIVVGSLFLFELEYHLPFLIGGIISVIIVIAAPIIFLFWLIEKLLKKVIFPLLKGIVFPIFRFDWQVYRRHYFPKNYRLSDQDYGYGLGGIWVHIIFWIQILIILSIAFFGRKRIYGPEDGLYSTLSVFGTLIGFYTILSLIVWQYCKHREKKELYEIFPHLKPKRTNRSEKYLDALGEWLVWFFGLIYEQIKPFVVFLKALYRKVCPLLNFID